MIYQEKSSDPTSVKLGGAILDAAVFVGLIIIVTFVLVLLFKYRCMKVNKKKKQRKIIKKKFRLFIIG